MDTWICKTLPMKWLFVPPLVVGLLVGSAAGYVGGCRSQQFRVALQENRIAAANLRMNVDFFGGTNLPPQLQEYLKARIYCNVYHYYPRDRGYLLPKDWDFGPVKRDVLGNIGFWKDPHEKVWDWAAAVTNK